MVPAMRDDADPELDGTFLARLRAGEEAAYRALVRRHHGALVALARTVLRDGGAAEEAVQETWLAVVTGLHAFEGRSRLSTWIAGILLNKARSRAVRDARTLPFSALEGEGSNDEIERFLPNGHWAEPVAFWEPLDPERVLAGRELWAHAAAAIEALPPSQRAVMILRDIEDVELDEIARMLGLAGGHVRVLLHRARARVRARLDALLRGSERLTRP